MLNSKLKYKVLRELKVLKEYKCKKNMTAP